MKTAAKTAFLSINKSRVKSLAEKGGKRASLVLKLSERQDQLIFTARIGNTVANDALASLGVVLLIRHLGNVGAAVSAAIVTVAVLIKEREIVLK